jgi:hypothetical protein
MNHMNKKDHLIAKELKNKLAEVVDVVNPDIVKNDRNMVYLYDFPGIHYYGVRGFVDNAEWLVIFGAGGVMETAFPPMDIDDYLYHRGFVWVGMIEEVLKWTREAMN